MDLFLVLVWNLVLFILNMLMNYYDLVNLYEVILEPQFVLILSFIALF